MTLYSAVVLLLLVMDPFGNIPFFLAALQSVAPDRHKRIIVRELLIALAALVVFLFFGKLILDALHVSEPSLSIAGGIILFLIALRMIFPRPHGAPENEMEGDPFIVPLAIPFVAGPSALATVLLIRSREPDRWPEWLLAIVIAWLATGIVLYFASSLRRYMGERARIAVERLMGMILTVIAVEMFMNGLGTFLRTT